MFWMSLEEKNLVFKLILKGLENGWLDYSLEKHHNFEKYQVVIFLCLKPGIYVCIVSDGIS